jgi:NTP pyrophosphatase (non-canonical NTP hydrolase)
MKRPTRDFGEIEKRVRRFRDDRDWRKFHKPKDLAMSVSIEAAELLEHFQWKSDAEIDAYVADPARRAEVASEMADVLLLLVSAADVLGVDLHAAALAKLEVNAAKYPVAKSKGHARKYDRLD